MDGKSETKKEEPKMCVQCKQFWGSPANKDMCSKCFNDIRKKEGKSEANSKPAEKEEKKEEVAQNKKGTTKGIQENKARCFDCKKKVGLLGVECKCGYVYCNAHRLPQDHNCDFNHEEEGKDKLKKQIIKVSHQKINEV